MRRSPPTAFRGTSNCWERALKAYRRKAGLSGQRHQRALLPGPDTVHQPVRHQALGDDEHTGDEHQEHCQFYAV